MIHHKLKKRLFQEISFHMGGYFVSPEIASLVVTYACNFRCKACSVWRMAEYGSLAEDAWMKIADELMETLNRDTVIEISGGECMLRKELVCSLLKKLKKHFQNVGINSNGSLLREDTVIALKESGVSYVKVSLYSLDENVHDELRGFSGAALQVKQAIELLSKHGIVVDIGVLVTLRNIETLPALIEDFNQERYGNVRVVLQPLDEPIGLEPAIGESKAQTVENLWPTREAVAKLFGWLKDGKVHMVKNSLANIRAIEQYYYDKRSATKRRCFAGQRGLVIDPRGNVSFCYNGKSIGNLEQQKLKRMLHNESAKQARIACKKCNKPCRIIGCNFQRTLGEVARSSLHLS